MCPTVQAMQKAVAAAQTLVSQEKVQVNVLRPVALLFKKSKMERAMRCASTSRIKALMLIAVPATALTMQTADVKPTAFVWRAVTTKQPQKAKPSAQHF